MKYVLAPVALLALIAVLGGYWAFSPNPTKSPPSKPAVAARYWPTPKLIDNFAPLKPVSLALLTPQGWVQIRGCSASSTAALHRVVLICR